MEGEDQPRLESRPVSEPAAEHADNGDGQGRRRRRGRGGRGGERSERGERTESAPRENAVADASPQSEMFEPAASVNETPRPETPRYEEARGEAKAESHQGETPVPPPAAPAAPAPQRVYTSPPLAFQAVSQHDEFADEPHRPNRRRKHHASDEAPQETALQLVETQAAPQPVVMEDELHRRTKPRRRRGSQTASEPLQLVETQPSTETSSPDTPPTP